MGKRGGRAPKPIGHGSVRRGRCGLCGRQRDLSKTHVPPRCAGNRGRVKRFTVVSDPEHRAAATTPRIGGIHFFGLCSGCNSGVQAGWDPAYCEMARALSAFVLGSPLLLPRGPLTMPADRVQPGAVARSVLVGALALNPRLRVVNPETATALLEGHDSVPLPPTLRLGLALTLGPIARVTGSIAGYQMFRPKVRGQNIGMMSLAQIYFPPLAWQLADADRSVLFAHEGWVDVSDWLNRDPSIAVPLNRLVPRLPVVHPHRVSNGDDWVELLGDGACFIVESNNAIPSSWTSLDGT